MNIPIKHCKTCKCNSPKIKRHFCRDCKTRKYEKYLIKKQVPNAYRKDWYCIDSEKCIKNKNYK